MTARLRIEIFPADLARSIEFYQRLGFTVQGIKDDPPYASLVMGSVRIGMAEAEPVAPELRSYPAMTEIVIEVDDIQAYLDQVVAQGIVPAEPLQMREWGLIDFRVFDPDGYFLRFTNSR